MITNPIVPGLPIDRVIQAEQNSDVCAAFFGLIDDEDHPHIYKTLMTYD